MLQHIKVKKNTKTSLEETYTKLT